MLLEPAIVAFCMNFQGQGNAGCKTALDQISNATKTTEALNELESYSQNYVYKNINGELIKTMIAVVYIENSIQQQRVMAEIPFKPFEFDVNLGVLTSNMGLKYRYEW